MTEPATILPITQPTEEELKLLTLMAEIIADHIVNQQT